jgi:starch phosphorylase
MKSGKESSLDEYFHIALFSMEIGIDPKIPTYSGGLGVLAGDILRSCADLHVPLVAVTLASNKGYVSQRLDAEGNQSEVPTSWRIDDFTTLMTPKVMVPIGERLVKVQAWRYILTGVDGYQVPVYLLDTDLFENSPLDREITSHLYGGDNRYRLSQEIILGIGGMRMLAALGHSNIRKYHMNEGHSALVAVELTKQLRTEYPDLPEWQIVDLVRQKCVFTTHTPIPAGHDLFSMALVKELLSGYCDEEEVNNICHGNDLNMTLLALEHSGHINGVAKRHEEISRDMFPGYPIDSITNGVHHMFWTSKPFRALYDKHISGWRKDPFNLRYVIKIPLEEIMQAHREAKKRLIDQVNTRAGIDMDNDTFTIGFARRMTRYKRPYLLFNDSERLLSIAKNTGSLQVVLAGKAHPKDPFGKELIKQVFAAIKRLKPDVKVVFLENYDMELALLLTSGVDLWLNTPKIPCEASGTSGMKACLNGVPSLSILDGWWLEGCVEGVTGWAIETKIANVCELQPDDSEEATSLYDKLEQIVIPLFYNDGAKWAEIMRYAIAFNASFFNSHRMVQQYLLNAYFP